MTYTVGSVVTISVVFADASGAGVNPTVTPVLLIQAPDGTQATPTPVSDGSGAYHYDLTVAISGLYFYRWTGTGNGIVKTVQEGSVTVAASIFRSTLNDLCNLSDVKPLLDIKDDNNNEDLKLGRLISGLSQLFLNMAQTTGFTGPVDYMEQRNGTGTNKIVVYHFPIKIVRAVTIDGRAVAASPDGVRVGWINDRNLIQLVQGSCPLTFTRGSKNVLLDYSAGYDSIPADVSDAVALAVVYRYKRIPKLAQSSESLSGIGTVSYSKEEVPPEFTNVVKQYKDRTIIEL